MKQIFLNIIFLFSSIYIKGMRTKLSFFFSYVLRKQKKQKEEKKKKKKTKEVKKKCMH